MDDAARARLLLQFEALPADTLNRLVRTEQDDYTPEAIKLAKEVLEARQLNPNWVEPGERVRCPNCGHTDGLAMVRVFLPSDTPEGVTPFEARSCRGCGLTTFVRTDEL